ncbi:MAG TPA: PAS domain-containing protein [Geomonas sp.]|nr:PAS domain-containing protein [Geomonas sp.]
MFCLNNKSKASKAIMDRKLLFTGLCLIVVYWLLDAALDVAVFKEASFVNAVTAPPHHQIVDRLLVLVILLSFARYGLYASQSRESLEEALQDALKNAEHERAKLVAVVEAMGDGISIQAPDLTVLYQNQVHQQITGSHAGEPCYQAYRHESAPCQGCHLLEAFQEGGVHRLEVRREGSQGPRWYEILGSAARDEAGRVTAGVEVMRDITERKAAEQAVGKQAALLQHLIDTIPNPVYYQDANGRFIWCNFAFAAWLGKPRELLIGRTIAEVAPAQVSRAFQEKEPAVQETTLLRGDGELRDIIFYKSVYQEQGGEPGGLVGAIIDITLRKRAEQEIFGLNAALTQQAVELQQVNRELEAFNHAISHDLRTSLTRIYSYAQLLQDCEGTTDQDRASYVQGVNEGCLQVEGLLNSLLSLSRATEVSLKKDQVDLSTIASQIARGLQMADPHRSASFRIQPGLQAAGDQQLMQVALENLIGNAWKYTARAPETLIEVGAVHSGAETVFFVKDNGAGYDSSQSDDLFKPFRRLHSSTDFPGNGLGLATVRRIIRRHNGRVWGESSPGQGATFFFTVGT